MQSIASPHHRGQGGRLYPEFDSTGEPYLDAILNTPDIPDCSDKAIAVQIIQDNYHWLQSRMWTVKEVADHLFFEEMSSREDSTNLLLFVSEYLLAAGYHAIPKIGTLHGLGWSSTLGCKSDGTSSQPQPSGGILG